MKITNRQRARQYETVETYMVEDINNATDEEIINYCDPCNFGGYVTRYANNTARVIVNID